MSRLILGDCLQEMQTLEPESVDAVICDPPYGLAFMGKEWDHGVPGIPFWGAALRVAKPGAHLVAFGGCRTWHRLACAIEDAGWEIRDCLMFLFGTGFPKSLDVSKAMDKVNGETDRLHRFTAWMRTTGVTARQLNDATDSFMGSHYLTAGSQPAIPTPELWARIRPMLRDVPAWADTLVERIAAEREVLGEQTKARSEGGRSALPTLGAAVKYETWDITAPATDLARQWQGWGTALKPAWESIILAQKPYDLTQLGAILARTIQGAICQLPSFARGAGWSSTSSQSASIGDADSALWRAVERCNTPDDLYALMATSPSEWATISSLSIAWSWLDTLAAISAHASTFTTEMASSLTTDLRILSSSPSRITPATIIEAATAQPGIASSALPAASILSGVRSKLLHILAPSVPVPVTSSDGEPGLRPNWRPIILARKPLTGTVAQTVAAHGTGALNIDGCRVPAGRDYHDLRVTQGGSDCGVPLAPRASAPREFEQSPLGRWPANVCLDEAAAALLDAQSGERPGMKIAELNRGATTGKGLGFGSTSPQQAGLVGYGDTGGASRFFYTSKASRREREAGLDGMPEQKRGMSNGAKAAQARGEEYEAADNGMNRTISVRNAHPTVKPLALMRWLCRLVTPPGGTILDPFMGSGTTGCAAALEGFRFIGIEREAEYLAIAERRIAHWAAVALAEQPTLDLDGAA